MDLSEFCITKRYTLQEALEQIQKNKNRNVFVLDENNKVAGILSQGDAVRFLCRGIDIHTSIEALFSPNFFYLREKNWNSVMDFVRNKGVTLIPILDEGFHLIDVITPADIINHLEKNNGTN